MILVSFSLGTTGNHSANLKVEVGPQFSAQLVDYKCDSGMLVEVLGVIYKI